MDYINDYFDGHRNDPNARFLSFDICHNYFLSHKGVASRPKNINESVMTLWGYLSSWGMLRGRGALKNKNPYYLKGTIEVIDKYGDLFDVDLTDYPKKSGLLVKCYDDLESCMTIEGTTKRDSTIPSLLLITKTMFGVFSCIPAIDVNVGKYFNENKIGSLRTIHNAIETFGSFYESHKDLLKPRLIATTDWNGLPYERRFNSVRLLDMYAYSKGQSK